MNPGGASPPVHDCLVAHHQGCGASSIQVQSICEAKLLGCQGCFEQRGITGRRAMHCEHPLAITALPDHGARRRETQKAWTKPFTSAVQHDATVLHQEWSSTQHVGMFAER